VCHSCVKHLKQFYIDAGRDAKYCDERVCLSVCLSVCVGPLAYFENHTVKLHQILCILPVVMALSFAGVVEICCLLPVLWMASCF